VPGGEGRLGHRPEARRRPSERSTPVLLYLFLNFVLAAGTLREGEPRTTPDGRPYLDYKGRHVRDLSDAEYRRLSAAEVRLFTGHLIAFHGIATIFFIWLDRRGPVAREG